MKTVSYIVIGLIIGILLFIVSAFLGQLILPGDSGAGLCAFLSFFHICITITCTGLILKKLDKNKDKDKDDEEE